MELLHRLRAHCWGVQWSLPVPASVLLDRQGRLMAIWAGPAKAADVLAETERAGLDAAAFHDSALPFRGRWLERPEPLPPLGLALHLMESGAFESAREFAQRAAPELSGHREFGLLLAWIGDRLLAANKAPEAIAAYEKALASAPDDITILNNLAWQRAAHPDPAVRDGTAAVKFATRAAELSHRSDPAILDTLAAACAEAGRFQGAITTAESALALAKAAGNSPLAGSIEKSLTLYRNGRAQGR
jgi:tetratricopeptide (TPR) repeat protein